MGGNFDLPAPVAEVAAVIGRQNALLLVGKLCPPKRARGASVRGRAGWLYVPKQTTPRLLEIVECPEIARALVRAFPGELRWFPPCQALINRHRDAAVRRLLASGERVRIVALLFDITPRAVRKIEPCRN